MSGVPEAVIETEMPNWEGFMIPVLRVLSDGLVRHRRELMPQVADLVGLTAEQRQLVLPVGGDPKWENRVGWALSFLTNVGALQRPQRGRYEVTEAGRRVLELFPSGVRERQLAELGQDPNSLIREYTKTKGAVAAKVVENSFAEGLTPLELVQSGIDQIRAEVAQELLDRLRGREPGFFEQAVVDLLLAMGYGGTTGSGSVTQLSNDGGIDGVIDQDILGLRRVYIQAKRYAEGNSVGRPDVQGFVGALSGKADSGVFITTSRFSDGAKQYVAGVPTRIILIDGWQLASLMIRYGVGVQVRETYQVVELDEDFFA